MSKKRRKFDFYPTSSAWITKQLLNYCSSIGGQLLEPCTGNNDIANILAKEFGVEAVTTNDLNPECRAQYHEDATCQTLYDQGEFDWIITNPPFNSAMEILEKSYENAIRGCAFLLRLSFLEPTRDRGLFLAEHPPTTLIVLPRYSFTGDGKTDSVTCAWMIWDKQSESQEIHIVPRQKSDFSSDCKI